MNPTLLGLGIAVVLLMWISPSYGQAANPVDIIGLQPIPDTLPRTTLDPRDYHIENGHLSEAMLYRYLKRAVAMQVADQAPYPSYCGHGNTGEEFACWMEFARYVRPKYVQLAGLELDVSWKFNGVCDHLFFPPDKGAIGQFKRAVDAIHNTVDSQIICEASMIEFMPRHYRKGESEVKIPDWVKTGLPELPELKNEQFFDREKMLFPHKDKDQEIDVFIDITKPMSLAWYYYLATMYIDFGYEALKFCQINRTAENDRIPKVSADRNLYWTNYLFTKLRNYAKQKARRGFVLINSQTQGLFVGDPAKRQLLLDMHVGPIGIQPTDTSTPQSGFTQPGSSIIGGRLAKGNGLGNGTDYESQIALHSHDILMYNHSLGGRHPMGWDTRANPFLVEMDCFGGYLGGTNPPQRDNKAWQAWAPWAWDETTWLVQQSEAYRRQFMVYAYHRVRSLDSAGYIQFAAKRPYRVGPGAQYYWYHAYNCDDGFKDAAIIKNLWDGNETGKPETHKYYNRWPQAFATIAYYNTEKTPKGKCYFGDFNGDRQPDILETADTSKGQYWKGWRMYLKQDSMYSFHRADTTADVGDYFIGDFDGDGYDDFLLMSDYWVLYTAEHIYKPAAGGVLNTKYSKVYTGDFNGDGRDDLLLTADATGAWTGYKILTATGNGFKETFYAISPFPNCRLYVGDFNGDGKDDILATANSENPGNRWDGYRLYHSTGNGFEQKAYGKWPSYTEQLIVNDWNGDGFADFTAVSTGKDGSNWYGSKTYLSNYRGDHFLYAFDFNDLGMVSGYVGYEGTQFIPYQGKEPYLIRFNGTKDAEEIQIHRALIR